MKQYMGDTCATRRRVRLQRRSGRVGQYLEGHSTIASLSLRLYYKYRVCTLSDYLFRDCSELRTPCQ